MQERGPHNEEKTSCAQRAGEVNEVSSSNSLGFLQNARTRFLKPGTSGFVGSDPTSDKIFSPKSVIVGIPEKKFKQKFFIGARTNHQFVIYLSTSC